MASECPRNVCTCSPVRASMMRPRLSSPAVASMEPSLLNEHARRGVGCLNELSM